jgi:aldose 1-epimerase
MQLTTTPAPSVGRGTLDGFETVTLCAGELEAAFAPAAGMAGVSLRHAGEELLDRRRGLRTYVERGAVMGIPLLHPWANRLAGFDYAVDGRSVRLPDGPPLVRCEEHGLPIHALLSGSPRWRALGRRRLRRRPPHSGARLRRASRAARRLSVPAHADPRCRARRRRAHDRDHAHGDFDRIADRSQFAVAGGGRRITVMFATGYPAAQIFSPPGAQFVCFEPMTAPTNVLRSGDGLRRVPPGAAFTAVFRIDVAAE